MRGILLVSRQRDTAALPLLAELNNAGLEVEHIEDGATAQHRMLNAPPALTLLDAELPHADGLRILENVRARSDHPIILLTAREREADRLRGFELGADDYVCKPYSAREVVARVRTVLRRAPARHATPRTAEPSDAARLALTRRELSLLRALVREPGRVLTRSELLEVAFVGAFDVNERAVDTHIKNLRRKLAGAPAQSGRIRSVYGVGFAWDSG